MALRAPGHKLVMEWSGEYGIESSSTGFCRCGWTESASNQEEVRFEYRQHLGRVLDGGDVLWDDNNWRVYGCGPLEMPEGWSDAEVR